MNTIKDRANKILNEVKAGIYHDLKAINWALAVLGDYRGD